MPSLHLLAPICVYPFHILLLEAVGLCLAQKESVDLRIPMQIVKPIEQSFEDVNHIIHGAFSHTNAIKMP